MTPRSPSASGSSVAMSADASALGHVRIVADVDRMIAVQLDATYSSQMVETVLIGADGQVVQRWSDRPSDEEGYATELSTMHAIDFIERHRNEPFFLYLPHLAIHFPWMTAADPAYRRPGGDYDNETKVGPQGGCIAT